MFRVIYYGTSWATDGSNTVRQGTVGTVDRNNVDQSKWVLKLHEENTKEVNKDKSVLEEMNEIIEEENEYNDVIEKDQEYEEHTFIGNAKY